MFKFVVDRTLLSELVCVNNITRRPSEL